MFRVMEMGNSTYETKDLYIAAFLRARGLELVGTRRNGSRVFFCFRGKNEAENLTRDFLNGAQVDVSLYTKAIQDLKTIIFSQN